MPTGNMLLGCHAACDDDSDDGYENDATFGDNSNEETALECGLGADIHEVSEANGVLQECCSNTRCALVSLTCSCALMLVVM
jgi:hypothetical protein